MFGFLKKAVGSLIDGVKKKLEGKPEEKLSEEKISAEEEEEEKEEEIIEEKPEAVPEAAPEPEEPVEPEAEEEKAEEEEPVFEEKSKELVSEEETPVIQDSVDDDKESVEEPAPIEEEKIRAEPIKAPEEMFEISEDSLSGVGPEEEIIQPEAEPKGPSGGEVRAIGHGEPEAVPEAVPVERKEEELEEKRLPPLAPLAPIIIPKPPAAPIASEKEIPAEPKVRQEVVREPVRAPAKKELVKAEAKPVTVPEEVPVAKIAEKKKEKPAVKAVESKPERKKLVEPEKAAPIIEEKESEEKKPSGFFGKLFGGLKKATEKVKKAVSEKTISEGDVSEILGKFELELIQANVASEVSEKICGKIKEDLVGKKVARSQDVGELIVSSLRKSVSEIVGKDAKSFFSIVQSEKKRPIILAFIGFNGSGKTTTIAKVANALKSKGYTAVIAAGDTFRAAAVEQAEIHGERLGIKVIKQQYGADAAAVIFDSVKYAEAKGIDFVLADTAGRQHTNSNLMEELKKIVRVNKPDMKILVVDSLSGSDSVLQAKSFDDAVGGLSGVILTKVDVDEKGGTAISVAHTIGKPIFFLGMGQEYSDLKEFDVEEYLGMVFGDAQ